jgi:hypothetical protein
MKYEDTVIKKYFDLIKANTDYFKEFYQGDPIRVPHSNLPCVILSKNETRVGVFSNREDEHGMLLTMTVVVDIRAEINDDKAITSGIAQLYDIIEGRDSAYKLKTNSLLHILRNNILVDQTNGLRTDLDSITSVDYGMTLGKRAPEAWGVEAQITFVAHHTQIR